MKIEQRKDGTIWIKGLDPKTGMETEKVFGDDEAGMLLCRDKKRS